jgi:hypothetical protein
MSEEINRYSGNTEPHKAQVQNLGGMISLKSLVKAWTEIVVASCTR